MSLALERPTIQYPLILFFVLSTVAGVAMAQHKNSSSSPPPKPAPHVSAPASRPQSSHTSSPTHTSNMGSRPAGAGNAGPRTGNTGTRFGNNNGTRPKGNLGNRNTTNTFGRNGTNGRNMGTGHPGAMNGNGRGFGNARGPMNGRGPNATAGNFGHRPPPGRQVSLRGGGMASIRPNGQIRSINRNGMQINRGLNGTRRVESFHNGARVVSTGRHSGYVQRAYVTRNGRSYVSRTVVVNHVTYTTVYRSYSYHGYCCYYGYHPAYYYAPVYYGWAYNPWPAPVYYGWGWGGSPWYGYYGGYFAPYPSYPSAAFWLTDYLIAANLQAAYQARQAATADAANPGSDNGGNNNGNGNPSDQQNQPENNDASASNSGQVQLSPEVKQAIADEVKAQLAAEQSAAGQDNSQGTSNDNQGQASSSNDQVPPALDPIKRTFVVASDMAVNADGQECQLTQGDVLTRMSDTPDSDQNVAVTVAASKKSDCAVGKQVMVKVDDLQEMYNHFQEQVDQGMKDMAAKQGTNGLPKAPDTKTTPSDVPPPPPDNNAAKALDDQQQAADQAEAQVVKEAFAGS
jgi:hypothetical protein